MSRKAEEELLRGEDLGQAGGLTGATELRLGRRTFGLATMSSLGALAWGCGDRHQRITQGLGQPAPVALDDAVVLRDEPLERLLILTSPDTDADGIPSLRVQSVDLGPGTTDVLAAVDNKSVFVLSKGVFPRRKESDASPSLRLFDGRPEVSAEDRLLQSFRLDDAKERLALDPLGEWVVAFGAEDGVSGGRDQGVVNPNELVLFDLRESGLDKAPEPRTIRSFGGAPVGLLFTEELPLPGGEKRRFLVVRTDRDVTIVDLEDLEAREKTIKLPQDEDGRVFAPAQMAISAGEGAADEPGTSRLAIRLQGTSDVVIVDLGPPKADDQLYSPVVNIIDAGGEPSWIEFVRTDGGLRLAVLVPGRTRVVLIDPLTTVAEKVDLPEGFTRMRRVTEGAGGSGQSTDVALLWGSSQRIAFLSLGTTSRTPYRSVQTAELSFAVNAVTDVPGELSHLKVLTGLGSDVFVLDLRSRQSFPLSSGANPVVRVSPDGQRLWIYSRGREVFSGVTLADLHPQNLFAEPAVSEVYEISRNGDERTALVLHFAQGWHATVLDARTPDTTKTAYYYGLHLEGVN